MTVLRSGSATDVGRVRKVNQDIPLESTNLYAVADGMGGHVGGEVAARVAVETLLGAFTREPTTSGLREAFAEANHAVWQESQTNSDLRGMGTTLTAIALVGAADGRDVLALANVGDSRAYVYSEGQIVQVTADHSLAEERVRHGEMTEAEAAVHPQRHILTRALGVSSDVETDMWELQLRSGDRVVLCSDGLSNEIGLEELAEVLSSVSEPLEAAQRLVQAANDHGGADNITVVVVDVLVGEEDTSPASVVTPIGARAGAPLVMAEAAAAAATMAPGVVDQRDALTGVVRPDSLMKETSAAPRVDTLAPGSQLGFSRTGTDLSSEGQGSGEFLLGNTSVVPVARSTTKVPLAPKPAVAKPPEKESRRERRRRLGIPRRITLRVIAFVLLVAAVPVAALLAIHWYAYDNWFTAVRGNQIVIMEGHPGGVLWYNPKVAERTKYTTADVSPTGLSQIRSGVQEPTEKDAANYVRNMVAYYAFQTAAAKAKTTPSTTIPVGPNGALPTITAPPSTTSSTTTTTVPGQTATTATPATTAAPATTAP